MTHATILRRAIAFWIDCTLVFAVFVAVLQVAVFVPVRHLFVGSEAWFRSGWNAEAYTLLTISLPVWLYFILCEVAPWRATPGKRLLKPQTLDAASGQRMSLKQAIVRTIIMLLAWEIAHFTNNIPVPIWYDPNQGFRLGFAIVPLLVLVYLGVAQFTTPQTRPSRPGGKDGGGTQRLEMQTSEALRASEVFSLSSLTARG